MGEDGGEGVAKGEGELVSFLPLRVVHIVRMMVGRWKVS